MSDLDVAVELDRVEFARSDESGGLTTWMQEAGTWRTEIQALSPWKVQLEMLQAGATPTITDAINASNVLVYQKTSSV